METDELITLDDEVRTTDEEEATLERVVMPSEELAPVDEELITLGIEDRTDVARVLEDAREGGIDEAWVDRDVGEKTGLQLPNAG